MALCVDTDFMKHRDNNGYEQVIRFPRPKRTLKTNVVYCADNLEVMRQLPSESIDLIYIDPPFNTGTLRKSKTWDKEVQTGDFDDKWGGGISSYVLWMKNRLREMHRLLKPTGVLCVHLDYNSVHYIKVELDSLFGQGSQDRGADHLINEIIWCYRGGGVPKNAFAKKHDSILCYGKNSKINCFNLDNIRVPYSEDVLNSNPSRYDKSYRANAIYSGYKPNPKGKHPEDWIEIQPIMPSDKKERVEGKWPTQKPLKLLSVIIKAFSNENQVVADFFCGCGTTLSSANSLNRKWIGIDISKEASKTIRKRMARDHNLKVEIVPLKSLTKAQILRLNPFEFEKYCVRSVGGIPNEIQRGDGGVDGFLQEDGTPIQVKKSPNVGRPVIDSFHKHLQKNGKGVIIAKSFSRGAKEEVARLRLKEGYEVTLITIDDILRDAS